MAINKKFSPINALNSQALTEFGVNRNLFLKPNKAITFFGPGHMPNIIGTDYYVPTDWIPKGYLLYPPQIVWLETRIMWSQSPHNFNYLGVPENREILESSGGGEVVPGIEEAEDPMHKGFIGNNWAYRLTDYHDSYTSYGLFDYYPNPALAEKWRLMDVFTEVQERINKIRKGRTWVGVFNWFDDPEYKNLGLIEKHLHLGSPDFASTWWNCNAGFIEVPDPSFIQSQFYGTDFLGIFCGNHFIGPGDFFFPWIGSIDYNASSDVDVFPNFNSNYNRLKGTGATPAKKKPIRMVDRFSNNWSSRLFHPDFTWPHYLTAGELPPYQRELSDGSWTDINTDPAHIVTPWIEFFGGLRYRGSNLDPFTRIFLVEAGLTDKNTTGLNKYSGDLYDAIASKAFEDKIDILHPGGTSAINVDYLLTLIAKRYGFNKNTGKDLT